MEPAGHYDVSPDGRELAYSAIRFDAGNAATAQFDLPHANRGRHPHPHRPRRRALGCPAALRAGRRLDRVRRHLRRELLRGPRAAIALRPRDRRRVGRPHRVGALAGRVGTSLEDGALLFGAQSCARTSLFRLGAGRDTEPKLVVRGGTVSGAKPLPNGGVLYVTHTISHPAEVFVLTPGSDEPRRLTHFTDAALAGVALGEVREMEFEGAAGESIQMFVVLPPDYRDGMPHPLVQVVHGGPHGISGDNFHPRWNAHLFASPGYVAALVNFQGSTVVGPGLREAYPGRLGRAAIRRRDPRHGRARRGGHRRPGVPRRGRRLLRRLHGGLDRRPHGPLPLHRQPCRSLRHAGDVRERRPAGPRAFPRGRALEGRRGTRPLESVALRGAHEDAHASSSTANSTTAFRPRRACSATRFSRLAAFPRASSTTPTRTTGC